jgi:virginiamycin B lyase
MLKRCHPWVIGFVLCAGAFPAVSGAEEAQLKIAIREYDVPTANSRPHDPAVAPDGALWFTGQRANTLGRLDPGSGTIREFPLKTPGSGPHGLAVDKDGFVWFTANAKAYIGRFDPRSGEVTEFPMPDPRARDPHSLVFDANGKIYFTVQNGNFVGRLEPRTGLIRLKEVPTPSARPYGLALGRDGAAYFCQFGTDRIGRIDPETLEISDYRLPEGARPRRIAAAPDGSLYYTDFARGYLGRLDPKTGQVREWASPGGAGSRPYGIDVLADGTVWYSESGVAPNTVVVFEVKGGTFERWPIPSGGGVVRNLVATPDGRLYLACSGVNKVAVVDITR